MIYNKIDANDYKEEFKKKFRNFGEKAPIILSFAVDDLGVTVIHENSGRKYFYEWDFTIPIKSFIHNIKQDISYKHYPRLAQKIRTVRNYTSEELSDFIANGVALDNLPSTCVEEKTILYRIDKILALKDEFVLIDEATGNQYLYKMDGSSIYFLKNYRSGQFKDVEEAGDYFFSKSKLISSAKEEK